MSSIDCLIVGAGPVMTRRTAVACGAAAAAGLAALSVNRAAAGQVDAAAFSATYPGRQGDVTVTVRFDGNTIEDIAVESVESPFIGGQAVDILVNEVLVEQTVEVDLVAGATFTSLAFLDALRDCVGQAQIDAAVFARSVEDVRPEYVTTADVVVVGAGGAGLVAALRAAQAGASVVLLEKSGIVGGNTNAAQSNIYAAGSAVQTALGETADPSEFLTKQMNNDLVHPDLVRAFVGASGEVADWFASLGVTFAIDESRPLGLRAEDGLATTTATINAALYEAILAEPSINLYKNIAARELVLGDDGTVVGVRAVDARGDEVEFRGTVVLATGGFGKNHELVVRYKPQIDLVDTDEIAPTTGDGLLMAQRIGAAATDLNQIMTHYRCVPGMGMFYTKDNGKLFVKNIPAGIYVNAQGVRVINEAEYMNNRLIMLEQEGGKLYHVFPAEYSNGFTDSMLANGFAYRADSARELGALMGIDGDALQDTVDAWNDAIAAGAPDPQFGRNDDQIVPIEGPLYGFWWQLGIHYCMGGLMIDVDGRVLDVDGVPIPGLFACGEVTGGIHGTTRVDGGALTETYTYGYIVGASAVAAR